MCLKISFVAVLCLVQLLMFECITNNKTSKTHKFLLDIPIFMCDKYGITFSKPFNELEQLQNQNGQNKNVEIRTFRNPEILSKIRPERMNDISYAYNQRHDILTKVNKTFNGVGILNYTAWQPIFRQNRGPSQHFYDSAMHDEWLLYPLLNVRQSTEIATMRFEFASKTVLLNTIKDIRKFLPSATWGLFDYPKCNFLSTENFRGECDEEIVEDNNKLNWLWKLKILLCPYIIIPKFSTEIVQRKHINARLNEARRIANKYHPPLEIYPYFSLRYLDNPNELMSSPKTFVLLQEILGTNIADGIIISEIEDNLNSEEKCRNYEHYFRNDFVDTLTVFL